MCIYISPPYKRSSLDEDKTSVSSIPIKMIAKLGAHFVPIVVTVNCSRTIVLHLNAVLVSTKRTSDSLNEVLPIKMTKEKFQRK